MKISIVTAVFNRAETVVQAIQSVRQQTYGNIEHLIIDGGSTDSTLDLIQEHSHMGLRIYSEPDDGIYFAINKGINLATGDVVGLMHSDDFFADNHVLERIAKVFEDHDVDAVYGDLDYISKVDESRIVRHWKSGSFSNSQLSKGWMPPHPTLFLRREVFEKLGNYNTSYKIAADYEAILRFFGKGNIRSVHIPEVLVKMRTGGESNKSLMRIIRKSREDYRALRSNNMGGLSVLFLKNFRKISQFIIK